MSDKDFLAAYDKYGEQALTYNGQTSTLYTSYGRVENGEVVIYGKQIKLSQSSYRPAENNELQLTGEPPLPGFSAFKWASLWKNSKKIRSTTKSLSGVKNAYNHWIKHSKDFSQFKNAKQYVEGAKDFLHNPPKGTFTKVRANGDILRYNPFTNTFGVMNADGIPKTLFKPTRGMEYWFNQ